MPKYFAVRLDRGPGWEAGVGLREQQLWAEHAELMDQMTAEGFIVLGGVLGEQGALLVIDAPSEQAVRTRLGEDPWHRSGHLRVASIESWDILLNSGRL